MIEVGLNLLHFLIEMQVAQDEGKVRGFPPHTAQKSLTNGAGLGRLIGRG